PTRHLCLYLHDALPICFKPGDEVYARPGQERIGTFAEFIAVREDALAHKPKSLDMEQAASIPLVGLTGWQALIEKAGLKRGQKRSEEHTSELQSPDQLV